MFTPSTSRRDLRTSRVLGSHRTHQLFAVAPSSGCAGLGRDKRRIPIPSKKTTTPVHSGTHGRLTKKSVHKRYYVILIHHSIGAKAAAPS